MKERSLGRTGARVSEVGLGCWQLGGNEWGDMAEERADQILNAAANSGVTFYDTADVYGLGVSEQRVGSFLAEAEKDFFVATKAGRFPEPGWPDNFSLDVLRQHIEASRERLGVEALDLLQTHCIPKEVMAEGKVYESLQQLQNEGLIRNFGASVETIEEARVCLQQDGISSLQIIFNIFRQDPADELLAEAQEKDVGIIVRLPMASGLLTGKFNANTTFPENDHRQFNRDGQEFNVGETFAGLPFRKGVELADELRGMVPDGMGMAEMAIRWVLDHEAVSVVIPGASSPEHVRQNAGASELPPLSADLHTRLRDFYVKEVKPHVRGEI